MKDKKTRAVLPSPYRGIHPFRYVDHPYFFGRGDIVGGLLAKVLLYRLVVLFGESGSGKSSLINAGLVPAAVREGFQPERLRVRPFPEAPVQVERIQAGQDDEGLFLPSIFSDERSAREPVLCCSLDRVLEVVGQKANEVRPLLIFDQFEELFTLFTRDNEGLAKGSDLQGRILDSIFQIVSRQDLKAKVVVVIREDFLGKLEIVSKRYPEIFDNYVRLRLLDDSEAGSAILGPFAEGSPFQAKLAPKLAERIVQDLSDQGATEQIHPTELQIVCSHLWDNYAQVDSEVTVNDYEEAKGVKGILEGFLKSELGRFGPVLRPYAIMALSKLITDEGTRDVVSREKLREIVAPKAKEAKSFLEAVDTLEKHRIINQVFQRGTYYCEVASEYLIGPIQQETHRLILKRERVRQRNRCLKIAAVLVMVAMGCWAAHELRMKLWPKPWGYVRVLSTGKVHKLRHDAVRIGRSTADVRNDISFLPKNVSRIHLILFKNRSLALDMRTINGTTVNSLYLPYGVSHNLRPGDIIVLAGSVPLQFATTPMPDSPSPSEWAVLVDGQARKVHYLSGERYFLSLDERRRIVLQTEPGGDTLVVIERDSDGNITIRDRADNVPLSLCVKKGDYPQDYPLYQIDPNAVFRHTNSPRDPNRVDYSSCVYICGETPFQIVPILHDVEPTEAAEDGR